MRYTGNQLVLKGLTLFLGVAVALFSLATPSYYGKTAEKQVKKEGKKKDDHSDKNTESAFVLFGDMASHVSTVHVQPLLKWIRDIDFVENPVVHVYEIIETSSTQFFQTLFRRIISPNAP